jgi:hypothetical protein
VVVQEGETKVFRATNQALRDRQEAGTASAL